MSKPLPRRAGRPRKHSNNAAKQAAYRRRKQASERQGLVERLLWKTPVREGSSLVEVERQLLRLTIRKLREMLRNIVTTHSQDKGQSPRY
jgi:hypothetical protein